MFSEEGANRKQRRKMESRDAILRAANPPPTKSKDPLYGGSRSPTKSEMGSPMKAWGDDTQDDGFYTTASIGGSRRQIRNFESVTGRGGFNSFEGSPSKQRGSGFFDSTTGPSAIAQDVARQSVGSRHDSRMGKRQAGRQPGEQLSQIEPFRPLSEQGTRNQAKRAADGGGQWGSSALGLVVDRSPSKKLEIATRM